MALDKINESLSSLRINSERMRADFNKLSKIGATEDGGVSRPAFSPTHLNARTWFREVIATGGLEFHADTAGNHSAVLPASMPGARTLLLGSHLDSVHQGGRYDGSIGVLAAIETLRTLNENHVVLPLSIEAIDFTDEEGAFIGILGSSALTGTLSEEALQAPRGGSELFSVVLQQANLTLAGLIKAKREPDTIAGYLELHIEQGKQLETQSIDIGIVSNIVGLCSYRLSFLGSAGHSGTTPMNARRDALQGASAAILACHKLVREAFPQCVLNFGQVEVFPCAYNVIPEEVVLALEFRAPDRDLLDDLENAIIRCARQQASSFKLELKFENLEKHPPVEMNHTLQEKIRQSADGLQLSHTTLASYAGHDAQSFAEICTAGMIFIPSIGGTSHSPAEYSHWEDCVKGANTLLQTALRFAAHPHPN